MTKTVVVPLYLLCNVYDTSHKMSKWFALNAVRRSHIFRGNQKTNHPILFLFSKHNRNHLQIQTHSEVSRFLGSRLKGWNLLHKIIYSNDFSLKKLILYFVMMSALLQMLLDINTIQLSAVCLLTLQKLA